MFQSVCRLCNKTIHTQSKSVKLFEKRSRQLLQQIELLTGLLLTDAPNMPKSVCSDCQTQLHNSVSFRQSIITVQLQLGDEALALNIKNEHEDDINNGNPQSIKEEKPALNTMQAMLQEEPELEIEFALNTDDEDEINQHTDIEENCIEDDFNSSDPDYKLPKKLKQEPIRLVTADDDEIDNNEEASIYGAVTHRRKTGKITTFICDQCGNHIKGRCAFELHLRRHFGVKMHKCELCPDSFCSQSELRRHIRRHTGERPFACRHCDRRFTDYSTRIKHERTHTNERPFACERCDKAFTNSSVLKNHMLTHTGERLFRCDLCNKSFLRQTHLTTHYRSIAHEKNATRLLPRQDNEAPQKMLT